MNDFIPLEAIIDKEVGESVVEMRSQTHQTMSLIWIRNLSEQHISFLQRSAEHHGLLIVDIVICCTVHHQILFIFQFPGHSRDITGLVAGQVVIWCGQTQISEYGV